MVKRRLFGTHIGKYVLVSHVVQARNGVQASGRVLVAQKCYCFRLRPLQEEGGRDLGFATLRTLTMYGQSLWSMST